MVTIYLLNLSANIHNKVEKKLINIELCWLRTRLCNIMSDDMLIFPYMLLEMEFCCSFIVNLIVP